MQIDYASHARQLVERIRADGFYKTERVIGSPQAAAIRLADGTEVLNLCANNYLGLADDLRLVTAAKAGLVMLTRSLALAHAADRIRVNAICPGPVGDTGIMDRNLASASICGSSRRRRPASMLSASAWRRCASSAARSVCTRTSKAR